MNWRGSIKFARRNMIARTNCNLSVRQVRTQVQQVPGCSTCAKPTTPLSLLSVSEFRRLIYRVPQFIARQHCFLLRIILIYVKRIVLSITQSRRAHNSYKRLRPTRALEIFNRRYHWKDDES
ncbi:hypothetical protein NP493_285g03038 [Ridgeia piscesae]|uniref:Uncharacterized protein n=1 Tax=Ridgeia piscesae TaxID=27915 RepID=A0AAD9NX23_RIDPI|nr:hypothetical protein NP493_285g03038 [Ridgeia piscesae]